MPNKKLFISIGMLLLVSMVVGILWFTQFFHPRIPKMITQEVEHGTLKNIHPTLPTLTISENATNATAQSALENTAPPLQLESLKEDTNTAQAAQSNGVLEQNWIQVGSFTDTKNLNRVLETLKQHNLTPETEETHINGKVAQRLFIGPYQSALQLETDLKTLETLGFHGYSLARPKSPTQ